jgi:predicted RNA binding protein YcfA (HicA-like mRNA interferase family)
MPKLKLVNHVEFTKKLRRAGYLPIRKTKHTIYYHPEKQITIPVPHKHASSISTGLLHKIVKEMGMTIEEFNGL